ncbi:MAG TPA: ABC transporter permease, partial [Anaerolineae bacterium]|nr:ABC transporter permease [Anaerolineae bacterium]
MNPRAVWTIFRKDVIDAVRNRYLLITVLSPVVMALIFKLMFGATTGNVRPITIVAYDPGHSRLVAALEALPGIQLVRTAAAADVSAEVEARQAVGGLAVPAGFDAAMAAGEQPELTGYLNQQRSPAEQEGWGQVLQQQIRALANQPPPARLSWVRVAAPAQPQASMQAQLERMLLIVLLMMALTMTGGLV